MEDIELKRLDSLARNRASAQLKRNHFEEWRELFERIHQELLVERELLGKVERSRNEPYHFDTGDGTCDHCGKKVPCQVMKKRDRERRARRSTPVPLPEE